ncbi:MAG TPA: VOC family protein [Sedimentisphaerales bacterium]|nr:VOC family protein [Sedimentisphaerales bacterium]
MGIRFSMIGIFVKDLGKMVAFYRDVLGVEVKTEGEHYTLFEHEGIELGMFARSMLPEFLEEDVTHPSGLNGTFSLTIDVNDFYDVDEEFERLVEAGARAVAQPKDVPWGQRCGIICDPDGNMIEISSWGKGPGGDF